MAVDLSTRITGHGPEHVTGLDKEFRRRVESLFSAAPASIQSGLGIYSGARDTKRQQQLWNDAVRKYGSVSEARKWVAPPGRSQHEKGTAIDIAYNGVSISQAPPEVVNWLHENAAEHGLFFPLANENWHIEMIGTRPQHPASIAAIKELQQHMVAQGADIAVDGIWGPDTEKAFAAMSGRYTPPGEVPGGMLAGQGIKDLQTLLSANGYTNVDVTGVYDPNTQLAVADFQKKNGLPSTNGIMDDVTKASLQTWATDLNRSGQLDPRTGVPFAAAQLGNVPLPKMKADQPTQVAGVKPVPATGVTQPTRPPAQAATGLTIPTRPPAVAATGVTAPAPTATAVKAPVTPGPSAASPGPGAGREAGLPKAIRDLTGEPIIRDTDVVPGGATKEGGKVPPDVQKILAPPPQAATGVTQPTKPPPQAATGVTQPTTPAPKAATGVTVPSPKPPPAKPAPQTEAEAIPRPSPVKPGVLAPPAEPSPVAPGVIAPKPRPSPVAPGVVAPKPVPNPATMASLTQPTTPAATQAVEAVEKVTAPPVVPQQRATTTGDPAVRALQTQLKNEGFDPGPVDGIMGPQTQAAVNARNAAQTGSGSGGPSEATRAAASAAQAVTNTLPTAKKSGGIRGQTSSASERQRGSLS